METKRFRWTKVTIIKALKGLFYASTGAGAIAGLNYVGTLQMEAPILTSLISLLVPAGINAIHEWTKNR